MAWASLIIAGLFEVGFTTCMKASHGFTRVWPSIGFLVFATLSFVFLTRAVQTIPLGVAYAVWTGIGAAGTAVVGFLYFKDPFNTLTLVFLALLIGSIAGLKMVVPQKNTEEHRPHRPTQTTQTTTDHTNRHR